MPSTINTTATADDIFGEPISVYTRAQAIDDGVLIDVSETAREAGIVWPVALTAAVWMDCVAWDEIAEKRKPDYTAQSESGRLWDVAWMASRAIRAALRRGHDGHSPIAFQLFRIPREGRGMRPRLVALKLCIGPGDEGEPVITIMQPGED